MFGVCYVNKENNTLPRYPYLTGAYPRGNILVLDCPKPYESGGSRVLEPQFCGLVKNTGHMFDLILELGLFEPIYSDEFNATSREH